MLALYKYNFFIIIIIITIIIIVVVVVIVMPLLILLVIIIGRRCNHFSTTRITSLFLQFKDMIPCTLYFLTCCNGSQVP